MRLEPTVPPLWRTTFSPSKIPLITETKSNYINNVHIKQIEITLVILQWKSQYSCPDKFVLPNPIAVDPLGTVGMALIACCLVKLFNVIRLKTTLAVLLKVTIDILYPSGALLIKCLQA